MAKKIAYFSILVVLIITGCSTEEENSNENDWNRNNYTPTVEIIQTITGALPLEERLTGLVKARNQVEIYPEITAPVTAILISSGERVEKGQELVRLRNNEAQERLRQAQSGLEIANAQVRQAEASLNQFRAQLSRMETLTQRNLESEMEVEMLRAQTESAEASLALAEAQRNQAASVLEERTNDLENTTVRSPVDGYVGYLNVEVGQSVNPSTQLFEVGDTDVMEIQISLNERMLSYIESGQTVSIMSEFIGSEPIRAQVDRISPFLNPLTNATEAEIVVQNNDGKLRSGMFVTIDILYGESDQAVLVPNSAVFTHPADGRRGVFIADAGSFMELELNEVEELPEIFGPVNVRFEPVQIVARGRQMSGVRGVSSGDYVVTMGQNLLSSGREQANVRIIEWDRMIRLQELQSRDLFEIIKNKLANRENADTTGA